jgi:hypothetical protein
MPDQTVFFGGFMKYIMRTLVFVTLIMLSVTGCKSKEEKQTNEMTAPHAMGMKKNLPVVIPDSIKGKWKAVKIAVTDKISNKSAEYTVPLGKEFAIPDTGLVISVESFLPQFSMNDSMVTSLSNDTKNPAAQARITEGGKELFKGWLFAMFPAVHAFQHPKYGITLVSGVPAG